MAKYSNNNITSLDTDWSNDPTNGLPYSGGSVQTFIRNELRNRAGAAWFDQTTNTLYFFRDTDDRDAFVADTSLTDLIVSTTVMNFSSDMFRVKLTNNNGSSELNYATNASEAVISIDFEVQTKAMTDASWSSTGYGVHVKAYLDLGSTGVYTELSLPSSLSTLTAGTTFNFDILPYIAVGNNRVKFTFTSEEDASVTASQVYSVALSEMYIEMMNNTWYNAIVEANNNNASIYKLGGFKIVGSLSKTIHLVIYSGSSEVLRFEKLIGTTSYTDTAYNFTSTEGLDLSSLSTGTYTCKAYLTSDALTSLAISYSFMYVADGDQGSARLVCVNNVASKVYNYADNDICNYALYDCGRQYATPHILIQLWNENTPTDIVDSDFANQATGTMLTLQQTVEWAIDDTLYLACYFKIQLGTSMQVGTVPIDNSATYPAESGATFYLNASSRSNGNSDLEYIHNDATSPSTSILATWEKMAWVDGIDGWTTDTDGRSALLVPAGSKCTIPYRIMSGTNITFELCFRVSNVSDYDENCIWAADNPTADGFQGLVIRPTRFLLHSGDDVDSSNDVMRGKSFGDEQTIHLLITLQNNYNGYQGMNLAIAYINGCKVLQFEYEGTTVWSTTSSDFVIGSSSADVFIYSCRVYSSKVLGAKAVEQNYINSLRYLEDRATVASFFNSAVDGATREITYDLISNSSQNYNFFVLEMLDGTTVPSLANGWSKDGKAYANLEMHFGEHPLWDWKMYGIRTEGQGTSSMLYYRWNLRWRIDKTNDDKKVYIAYYDAPSTSASGKKEYNEQEERNYSKTVFFDGGWNDTTQQHPAVKRITAKINMASSMQSHKIGATRAYSDIQKEMELYNEAQQYAIDNNLPIPETAVYQYPAFGFAKTTNAITGAVSYEFIGLFTIGPDKGDKPTFGYDIEDTEENSIKDSLMTLEGTNHLRKMVQFNYPWNSDVAYLASNECLNIVKSTDDYDNGWEVGNCYGLSSDDASDQAAIQAFLESEFKPAYDVAFNNSTHIFPIALADETYGGADAATVLANINADTVNFLALRYDDKLSYSDMQFWIEDEYVLYYYDIKDNIFKKTYADGVTLITDLGTPIGETLDEQNEWFKAQRRARFISDAPLYWDIQDAIYHLNFCIAFGATDNFGKNSYPYKMKPLSIGGLWKWRQDDLDTIFDTDNVGTDSKPYYIEFEDSNNGSAFFGGSNGVFWALIKECFWDDYDNGTKKGILSQGKDMVDAMKSLGGGANVYEGLMAFFKKYFWDNAQEYFPSSAYNVDASFKYETAWLSNGQEADPLAMSLGNHYLSEKQWVQSRVVYIMSYYKIGPFGEYGDQTLGRIMFRPYNLASITVVPTMWMYPAVYAGEGAPVSTSRTPLGVGKTFNGPFGASGQDNFIINASNYLSSIGDLKDLQLGANYIQTLTINASKLRTFKIGDETETVTTNVPSLSFSNTACLETIDARNATSLVGSLSLVSCPRLLHAYLNGSSITQVNLPNGSKIESLYLPDTTTAILLKNLKFLTDLQLPSNLAAVRILQVENCVNQNALNVLRLVYNTEDTTLQFIRLVWDEIEQVSADDVTMLSNIANDLRLDGTTVEYAGINSSSEADSNLPPIIEGTVQVTTGMYEDDLYDLGVTAIEDYDGGLKRAISSALGSLYIIYDPLRIYIKFADDAVKNICANNFGDGYGLSMGDAAAVTTNTFGQKFRGNTTITEFKELIYFTGMTGFYYQSFSGCTNLTKIGIPSSATSMSAQIFANCSSLTEIYITDLESYLRIEWYATPSTAHPFGAGSGGHLYLNDVELTEIEVPTTITSLLRDAFYNHIYITSVTLHDGIYSIGDSAFSGCSSLSSVELPSGLVTLATYAFSRCTSLTSINIPSSLGNIPNYAFSGCTGLTSIYLEGTDSLHVGTRAFQDSSSLTTVNLDDIIKWCKIIWDNTGVFGFATEGGCNKHLYVDGVEVTDVVFDSSLTAVHSDSFIKCVGITSVTLPSSVVNIYDRAFQYCTSLTSVTIGASSVSIGAYAFGNCTSLHSLHIPLTTSAVPNSAFQSAGDESGTSELIIDGDVSATLGGVTSYFYKITISGNVDLAAKNASLFRFGIPRELRIGGNVTNEGGYAAYGLLMGANKLLFCEIGGTISDDLTYGSVGASGVILHLGYNGIAGTATLVNPSTWAKIYVGDGSSQENDDAVLAQYLADSDWSAYSDKLATWYSYTGGYKE